MWASLIPLIGTVIDKAIPDPQAAADAKLRTMELAQRGELAGLDAELKLALGQIEVNKVEAGTDMYRGGWRPGVGWACVAGLVYQFLAQPLLPWVFTVAGFNAPPLPAIDTEALLVLLTGMLGLGGLRTLERLRGRA